MGSDYNAGVMEQVTMESKETITVGLCRNLEPYITGMDEVERFIGKDFVFHDAEVDSVCIGRDGIVRIRLLTWSDLDDSKYYNAEFTLTGCVDVSAINYDPSICYIYELEFELNTLTPDIIKVIFDGVGIEFSCRNISIGVSECSETE